MIGAPTPRFVGNPGPADDRVPDPAAVVIRTPVHVRNRRHPDVTVRVFVGPTPVVVELGLVVGVFGRQIGPAHPASVEVVAGAVPGSEVVVPGPEGHRRSREPAVRGDDHLALLDEDRAVLGGRFGLAAIDHELGLHIADDVDAVEPFVEDIERGVRRVDLEILLPVEGSDPDEDLPGEEMELGGLGIAAREGDEFDERLGVEAEVVSSSKLDLDPAVAGPDLVALDEDKVQLALLVAEVLGALNVNVALDVAEPDVAPVVIAFRLTKGQDGKADDQDRCQDQDFLHRLSPSEPMKCNPRANRHFRVFCLIPPGKSIRYIAVFVLWRGHPSCFSSRNPAGLRR